MQFWILGSVMSSDREAEAGLTPPADNSPGDRAGTGLVTLGAEAAPPGGSAVASRRPLLSVFENKLAAVGLCLILVIVLFCFVGPLIYHTNQVNTNLEVANLSPSAAHPFGTDELGYDILGRLMAGGQSSLKVGFGVAILATSLGTLWGACAGFMGGIIDAIMMRLVDMLLAIPALFIIIYLATLYQPTIWMLIAVISVISWLVPARLIRGETLTLKNLEFIDAGHVLGESKRRIIIKHIIPNTVGIIVVNATFQIADAILLLALLSFLGFGLPPPAATWGGMLSNGVNYVYDGYWWEIYPVGIIIVLTVIAFNLVGDALRDRVDHAVATAVRCGLLSCSVAAPRERVSA